jgi:hypothetical protein
MRKVALSTGAAVLLLALISAVSIAAAPQAPQSSTARSKTLTFDVQFSPFTLIPVNPVRDPNSPFALGDEITFHDLLFSKGKQVGDELGSCVLVAVGLEVLANCSGLIRLPDGNIAAQFANAPGPAPKDLALTGGTGAYRSVGGTGRLVEFGNGRGSLALRVLNLSREVEGA